MHMEYKLILIDLIGIAIGVRIKINNTMIKIKDK